jgi:hypothetical protein
MPYLRPKPPAGRVKANYPSFIEPALATSIMKVPNGDRWIHEIKFDGYRVQVHIVDDAAKIFSRNGHVWTNRFKKIAADALQNELRDQSNKLVQGTASGVQGYSGGHMKMQRKPIFWMQSSLSVCVRHCN